MLETGRKDLKELTTVKGLIIPVDWDEKGTIIAVAVSTFFEEDYLIAQDPWGEELLAFARQKVTVSGVVAEDERGRKVITVKKYEILDE